MKVSQKGLMKIKQAISQRGWKVYDERWLVEASKLLEPNGNWHPDGPYAYGCSPQTWERFLQGTAIRDRNFITFCQALGVNPNEVAESTSHLREDRDQAPDAPTLYGREQELNTLEDWIFKDRCRLISIVGFAGIGKTRLVSGALDKRHSSSRLAERVEANFECLIWRRLDTLPPQALLKELLQFITNQQTTDRAIPDTAEGLVTQLLCHLKRHRCLLVLDNAEAILQGGACAGCYRAGYECYKDFFKRLSETNHQSCVLILSREKIRDVEAIEGIQPVRSLTLTGLDHAAVQTIFQTIGRAHGLTFHGSDQDWKTLVSVYGGNPLLLELVAGHILRQFNGNLMTFLEQGQVVFGEIRSLLDWHFDRLSKSQQAIMYQFAISWELTSMADLRASIQSPLTQNRLPEILDDLERQIPLIKTGNHVTIQPIFMKYVSDRLDSLRETESYSAEMLPYPNRASMVFYPYLRPSHRSFASPNFYSYGSEVALWRGEDALSSQGGNVNQAVVVKSNPHNLQTTTFSCWQ